MNDVGRLYWELKLYELKWGFASFCVVMIIGTILILMRKK